MIREEQLMWKGYIQEYYDMGLYDNDDVKEFVVAGWITEADYKDITGVDYVL